MTFIFFLLLAIFVHSQPQAPNPTSENTTFNSSFIKPSLFTPWNWTQYGSFVSTGKFYSASIFPSSGSTPKQYKSKIAFDVLHNRGVIFIAEELNTTQWMFPNGTYFFINNFCYYNPNYTYFQFLTNYQSARLVQSGDRVRRYAGLVNDPGSSPEFVSIILERQGRNLTLYGFSQNLNLAPQVPPKTACPAYVVPGHIIGNLEYKETKYKTPSAHWWNLPASCLTPYNYTKCFSLQGKLPPY